MLSTKFWQIIDESPVGKFVDKKRRQIFNTDPERIYVENVRSFFGMPFWAAKFLCDMAVRQGVFEKRIGLVCKNDDCKRIIATYGENEKIPETINCLQCEINQKGEHEFRTSELEKLTFYRLKKKENA